MAKDDNYVEVCGTILAALGGAFFKVQPDGTDKTVLATGGGRLVKNKIKLMSGDRCIVAINVYDLTKGRIVRRL